MRLRVQRIVAPSHKLRPMLARSSLPFRHHKWRHGELLPISHIRELVGAMDEKGAGRGILVTTSWFTAGCWIKAEQNNRIELIDGPRLRHLVKEHLHMDALVAPPAPRSRTWHP
jgi:restriction system protein